MLKKIILGVIIGTVVLTTGAGAIYAYQKSSDPVDEVASANSNVYKEAGKNLGGNNQYRLQQEECEELGGYNEGCPNQDCNNENCIEQYRDMENNCYRYNNEENGSQNMNKFCYRNEDKNQNRDGDCEQNCDINSSEIQKSNQINGFRGGK
jgi:hypothetical protein